MKGNPKKKKVDFAITLEGLQTVSMAYQVFFPAMLDGAKTFFEKMIKLSPEEKDQYQSILGRISALEKKLKSI